MAVDTSVRYKGIGSIILAHLEKKAKRDNKIEIILHARENAIKFYLRNGYEKVNKTHKIMGKIQHFLMKKKIN